MTTTRLDAARANLDAALREESQALTTACDAVNACGATSDEAAQGLRSAEAAHARSNAAAGELRGLALEADRADVPAQVVAGVPWR
jgi:hypothetical protein